MRRILPFCLVVALVFSAGYTYAQGFNGRGYNGQGGLGFCNPDQPGTGRQLGRKGGRRAQNRPGFGQLQQRLKLTDQQMQQIRQIQQSHRQQAFEIRGTKAAAREAMMKSIFAENANPATVQKNLITMQQSQAASLNLFVTRMNEINKILTPEQRTEFQKVLDERSQRRITNREKMQQRMQQNNPQ
jgi:Spy/CpxP family protein refolding chaperone